MTWDAYNRRKKTLREMLAIADRHRDLTLTQLLDSVEGAHDAFATETDVLFDLQMTWFQRLSGQLDRLVSDGTDSPEIAVVQAWVNTAAELPGARALLDAHRDEPALRKAFAKELGYLAMSAGLSTHADPTAHGRRIQDSAREEAAAALAAAPVETARPGFMARLRNAIAA